MDFELRNVVRDYLISLIKTENKSPEMAATIAKLYELVVSN